MLSPLPPLPSQTSHPSDLCPLSGAASFCGKSCIHVNSAFGMPPRVWCMQTEQISSSTSGPGSSSSTFSSVPGAPPISINQQGGNLPSTQTVTQNLGTSPGPSPSPTTPAPPVPATLSPSPGASNQQVSTSTNGPGSAAFGSSSVPGAPPVTSSQTNGNGQTTMVMQTIPQTFQNSNGGNVIVAPGGLPLCQEPYNSPALRHGCAGDVHGPHL